MSITIIGTSHIARQSVREVTQKIEQLQPDFICLELDSDRFRALLEKKTKKGSYLLQIRSVGIVGLLFALIAQWAEKKLGDLVGLAPGAEMLAAIRGAKRYEKKIVLVDQHIHITLRRLSGAITAKEKWRFAVDVVRSVLFPKSEIQRLGLGSLDLTQVPSEFLIEVLLKTVKTRYPNFYRVLITERNIIMAKNITLLWRQHPDKKILAVMGAGHKKEVERLIKQFQESSVPTILPQTI